MRTCKTMSDRKCLFARSITRRRRKTPMKSPRISAGLSPLDGGANEANPTHVRGSDPARAEPFNHKAGSRERKGVHRSDNRGYGRAPYNLAFGGRMRRVPLSVACTSGRGRRGSNRPSAVVGNTRNPPPDVNAGRTTRLRQIFRTSRRRFRQNECRHSCESTNATPCNRY